MEAKKIIDSVRLPTLSKTLFDIIEVEKRNPISVLSEIKRIVDKDPLLSAHILKVANSPLYGFTQKVRTISHAIGLLGIRKIRTMAFSFSIFDFLKNVRYRTTFGKVFNLILKKSLLISSISLILGQKTDYFNSEELYASGLLTEIGELVFFLYDPDRYTEIYSVYDKKLLPREKELFQVDHLDLGIQFCREYNLPDFFKSSVENHIHLKSDQEHSIISFISNQIAELLLAEENDDKIAIFKEVENHTKKLLHLSLSEIEDTIKALPAILNAFIDDFPEVQTELNRIIETGANLIISLMKKEMEMVLVTRELTDSQRKLYREKIFLSHMLNLSYFFSSLMEPERIIGSLFEYFDNFIHEFSIEFIYRYTENGNFTRIVNKTDLKGIDFEITTYPSLVRSKIANEAVRLEKKEMEQIEKNSSQVTLAFPISYQHNFYGFLLLSAEQKDYFELDLEMTYVQILSNIIANSFQNYFSFEGMKKESSKKQVVTQELIRFDKVLHQTREMVTELQKAEVLSELLPVIFHKLKNKITPILGYSQILAAKVQEPSINERIKKIEKSANDLAFHLNILRDYFKSEKIAKEYDNINNILEHLRPYLIEKEQKYNIEINLELDQAIPDDQLSCGQIETLFIQLVDNAIQAIQQKKISDGRIDIKTVCLPEGYRFMIRDNGIGIQEEHMGRVWTPFYTQFPDRAGIGLTLCEKVISNHYGTSQVRSIPGQFTEIEITFIPPPPVGEDTFPLSSPPARENHHGKILIVDDEAYLVDLMKEILMNEGDFEIKTTTNGKEALNLVKNQFDLVILDIRMPDVNGMQIFEHMKNLGIRSQVMMVTADPFSKDIEQFLRNNNLKYLKKPFELMRFKEEAIGRLIQHYSHQSKTLM